MDGKQRYELHTYQDPDFPFIFHEDRPLYADDFGIADIHWHEHLELLCFTGGAAPVWINAATIEAQAGHVVVINSNSLHAVLRPRDYAKYYCLILNKSFCESFGFDLDQVTFKQRFSDPELSQSFARISSELQQCRPHYKAAVKGEILLLLTQLFRRHQAEVPIPQECNSQARINMVREAISYMRRAYETPVSTADIAAAIGFSTCYLSRVFRDVTGYAVTEYLNLMRCSQAKRLLQTGGYTVSQAAQLCGFETTSYFTRVYKRYMGQLPSKERQEIKKEEE